MSAQKIYAVQERIRRLLGQGARQASSQRPFRARFHDYWYGTFREDRGLKLLREWLSPEQLVQFDKNNYFDVTGCHSGRRYRIRHGAGMNIHEIDHSDQPIVGWCFVPNTNLVAGDVMLAQKIALETDEDGAIAVAKSFSPRDRPNFWIPC